VGLQVLWLTLATQLTLVVSSGIDERDDLDSIHAHLMILV
jgi:hypothetical protein